MGLPAPIRVLVFAFYFFLVFLLWLLEDGLIYEYTTKQCIFKCQMNVTNSENYRYSRKGEVGPEVGFEQGVC